MACHWIKLADGSHVHLNMGRSKPKRCRFCTLGFVEILCDFPLMIDTAGKVRTCDAGMCRRCATRKGPDVDHCPTHKDIEPSAPGLPDQPSLF